MRFEKPSLIPPILLQVYSITAKKKIFSRWAYGVVRQRRHPTKQKNMVRGLLDNRKNDYSILPDRNRVVSSSLLFSSWLNEGTFRPDMEASNPISTIERILPTTIGGILFYI